jgi:hypothetical protein
VAVAFIVNNDIQVYPSFGTMISTHAQITIDLSSLREAAHQLGVVVCQPISKKAKLNTPQQRIG